MPVIKSDGAIDRTAGPSAAEVLADMRADVDRVLELIPDNRLEARRVITREWGFEPDANELQSIFRLAHDPLGQTGLSRELLRATLAVRLQIGRELRELLERDDLDIAAARRFRIQAEDLQRTRTAFEVQLRAAAQTMQPNQRAFLEEVGRTLMPSRDLLLAATALAPLIERLARVDDGNRMDQAVPGLSEVESALLCRALGLSVNGSVVAARPTRECTNALVLSAGIHADVAVWEIQTAEDGVLGQRQEVLERLRRYPVACEIVAARLRQRIETDQLAGVDTNTETLRQCRLGLASAFRKLATVLNQERPLSVGCSSLLADDDGLHQLLARSAAHDAKIDTARAALLAENERDLKSLKEAGASKIVVLSKDYDLKRERLRIQVLSGITAVLVVACAIVWGSQFRGKPAPSRPPLDDISGMLVLDETLAVGPMVFATVSRRSWDDLPVKHQLAGIDELGANAEARGYETVYLVDEKRGELGLWTKSGGAELKRPR